MTEDRHTRLNRLRWQSRRALLELDLLLERFWLREETLVTEEDEAGLQQLLALDDYDLWALVSGTEASDSKQLEKMVARIRQA
ncbi:MAG: succinate dehydrogenase assembly factor 2 [Rhodocyclales bacterium]|jgi:antitoxin CptB|nr:succinate dehydrogenase assembly factor 2 [Rhodocyclales bacterium]MDD2948904.1 succinate dehydrogenase assembly factor 2 [Rugosibacter sp.]MBH1975318.1 succinate dehydrogenase assembly factor 2 [Rhodocyclales bacterium]HPB90524.1 succinate dehydrogenase assembly factor 2 [Rugosibacter sp.]HQN46252.1 succinate dehydrogenase assembly factor 2 [Rugosibacter sp.]